MKEVPGHSAIPRLSTPEEVDRFEKGEGRSLPNADPKIVDRIEAIFERDRQHLHDSCDHYEYQGESYVALTLVLERGDAVCVHFRENSNLYGIFFFGEGGYLIDPRTGSYIHASRTRFTVNQLLEMAESGLEEAIRTQRDSIDMQLELLDASFALQPTEEKIPFTELENMTAYRRLVQQRLEAQEAQEQSPFTAQERQIAEEGLKMIICTPRILDVYGDFLITYPHLLSQMKDESRLLSKDVVNRALTSELALLTDRELWGMMVSFYQIVQMHALVCSDGVFWYRTKWQAYQEEHAGLGEPDDSMSQEQLDRLRRKILGDPNKGGENSGEPE